MPEIESIYLAARRLSGERRSAYLAKACGNDAALRARVEEMLRQGDAADRFFDETKPDESSSHVLDLPPEDLAPAEDSEGSQIGRYRVLGRIGEGGMGAVYMAQQDDPISRRVALKIIKLGMDTRQVVARFEAERQALAMMDHPNIAKLYDAGATATGRPYFVMELVRGVPITEFCDQNKLSLRKRLDLFIPVCRAIQSAHQKGVIHRDLKPSNILVAIQNDEPVPKVIDFGVAKATNTKLTDKTMFTQAGTIVGTPAYMSPEQAEMSGLDVDTRTDVYSLGVLLYELLAGSTPIPRERLRGLGPGQLQKILAEEEPEKPSTRLSTLVGEERDQVSARRGMRRDHLGKEIPADLDWIVMKCLEKDRCRRYDTVNGLVLDIIRHLTNEPVLARPPSAAYRFRKAYRRNRVVFTTVFGVAVALIAGVIVSTGQAVRATRAETSAKAAAARATEAERLATERASQLTAERDAKAAALRDTEAVTRFLQGVFASPDPTRDGRTITVAEVLDRSVKKLETDLAQQPERRARLEAVLAGTYHALGVYAEAIRLRERVLAQAKARFGPESDAVLEASSALAASYAQVGRDNEALQLREETLRLALKAGPRESSNVVISMLNLAASLGRVGRQSDALKLLEDALVISRQINDPDSAVNLMILANIANQKHDMGAQTEALALRETVLRDSRRIHGVLHPATIEAMLNLAASQLGSQRSAETIPIYEEALEASLRVHGREHPRTQSILRSLSQAYQLAGRKDDETRVLTEIANLSAKLDGQPNLVSNEAFRRLAELHAEAGRATEARSAQAKVRATAKEAVAASIRDTFATLGHAARLAWNRQDAEYAETRAVILEHASRFSDPGELDRVAKAASLRPNPDPVSLTNSLTLARRAVELGAKHQYLPFFQLGLGIAEFRCGHHAEAETILAKTAPDPAGAGELSGTASFFRSMALFQLGRIDEARRVFDAATKAMGSAPPPRGDAEARKHNADKLIHWMAFEEARDLLRPSSAK